MEQLKAAMKNKDKVVLESLRAIKSELLLLETGGGQGDITEEQELKLLQKMVKQRRDSAATFTSQGRADLAEHELAQLAVIESFLPEQLDESEVLQIVRAIIAKTGASSMADMGKVMGMATRELAGKADGKMISTLVRNELTN